MKKTICLSILSLFVLVGCQQNETQENKKDICLSQSIASIGFLSQQEGNNTPLRSTSTTSTIFSRSRKETNSTTEIDISELHSYVLALEAFTASNETVLKEETSDIEGYATKVTFTLSEESGTYLFYYNETVEEKHKDEGEIEYTLEGICYFEDELYTLKGEKEIEEDEEELVIEVKKDSENYVKIKQEIEENEIEYKYEITTNHQTKKFSLESEREDNKTEVKIKQEDSTYKFKWNKDQSIEISIQTPSEEKKYKVTTLEIEQTLYYQYLDTKTEETTLIPA